MRNWYRASTGNHQGLVAEEETGRSVAVTYDKADAALIAAAPTLRAAVKLALRNAESRLYLAAPLGASYGQAERASIHAERDRYAAALAAAESLS